MIVWCATLSLPQEELKFLLTRMRNTRPWTSRLTEYHLGGNTYSSKKLCMRTWMERWEVVEAKWAKSECWNKSARLVAASSNTGNTSLIARMIFVFLVLILVMARKEVGSVDYYICPPFQGNIPSMFDCSTRVSMKVRLYAMLAIRIWWLFEICPTLSALTNFSGTMFSKVCIWF